MLLLPAILLAVVPLSVLAYPSYGARRAASPRNLVYERVKRAPVLARTVANYTSQYPYTGAKLDGGPGNGTGGVPVPAPGDVAHYFQAPLPGAKRGPCPGLNTLANHGFISRDGITTYTELVAAVQNAYNVEYSISVVLAALGIVTDGDPITEKLSIGTASAETQQAGAAFGHEGGLAMHNTFELDASLTRDDYYLRADDFTFNATLFQMMAETVATTSSAEDPLFDIKGLSLYRALRYNQSRAENPNFFFPSAEVHNYGAATFLYEVFPSSSNNNKPDLATISSFFGAVKLPDGTYGSVPERFPVNYTNRITPYSDITNQSNTMLAMNPLPFGGNAGIGNWIPENATVGLTTANPLAGNGTFEACSLYMFLVQVAEQSAQPFAMLGFIIDRLNPLFTGCNLVTLP